MKNDPTGFHPLRYAMKKKELPEKSLEALQAVAKAISHSLDLEAILEKTADEVFELMELKNLSFFLYDEEAKILRLKVRRGLSPEVVEKISRIEIGEGLTGLAARERRIVTTDSVAGDPRSLSVFKEEGKQRSGCYIPLMSKERLYGVLSMGYHHLHLFSVEEMAFLETIGNLIGQAIENTRFYEELRRYSAELEKRVEEKTEELLKRNEDLKRAYEDLKIAQERLVKASRLAAIGEMGITVRHEINNPLTAILGETQLMLLEENLPNETRKNLRTIEQMSIRIRDVVKKLSDVKEDRTKEFIKGVRVVDLDVVTLEPSDGKEEG